MSLISLYLTRMCPKISSCSRFNIHPYPRASALPECIPWTKRFGLHWCYCPQMISHYSVHLSLLGPPIWQLISRTLEFISRPRYMGHNLNERHPAVFCLFGDALPLGAANYVWTKTKWFHKNNRQLNHLVHEAKGYHCGWWWRSYMHLCKWSSSIVFLE